MTQLLADEFNSSIQLYRDKAMSKDTFMVEALLAYKQLKLLEQHIVELEEPKTCDGCYWEEDKDLRINPYCRQCYRGKDTFDHYEPKDK